MDKQALKEKTMTFFTPINTIKIVGGAAILVGGYFLVKRLFTNEQKEQDEKDIRTVTDETTDDGSTKANISNAEAVSIATTQYDAMQGFGTIEGKLFDSLDGLNGKALQLVFQKFGMRPGLMGGYWPEWAGGVPMDLFSWYRMELNSDELARMQTIWGKSGIDIQRESNELL
ncbi:hypothetical protein [Phaeocystidibacter marisrubri]|uniref:hypothetical protein n=1 Tax=Phaeocystidibacter marisrubri TaxID=1577780 RepID=UPI001667E72C|nr:hypothetical protein [Phaeocystidibacter marisrubri]GGH78140.1 hypothetical protein GCM10011318_28910 [Phaeocystidibacter marisrubri]